MIKSEVTDLLEEAMAVINGGRNTEGAVWRLVDAIGILSEEFPGAIGRSVATGRGYQIVRKNEVVPAVKSKLK